MKNKNQIGLSQAQVIMFNKCKDYDEFYRQRREKSRQFHKQIKNKNLMELHQIAQFLIDCQEKVTQIDYLDEDN